MHFKCPKRGFCLNNSIVRSNPCRQSVYALMDILMPIFKVKTDAPKSSIVAIGTGSGKTESFLLSILRYCYHHRREPGIETIFICPMNALATDQAARMARGPCTKTPASLLSGRWQFPRGINNGHVPCIQRQLPKNKRVRL